MNQFELNSKVDRNKVFLVKRSELEKRFDIDYYRPQIAALEKAVRRKSAKKLSDFIIKMASGATPSVSEEDKYYSDEHNGVPFLRVQNLSTSGNLELNNVRFINKDTHEGYLKRSQVAEGDLLVKITGVGRMAIGSVAPKGFVGNTNQHMAVIRTESEEQSWYLANYLNLDTVEALATRRATGGTRPALDYPALRSIPIIENLDFSVIKSAEKLKQQKELQAKALLESIDQYLLDQLGITLPEQDNRLEKRMFRVSSRELSGGRFDVSYNSVIHSTKYKALLNSIYSVEKLKILSNSVLNGKEFREYSTHGYRYLRVTDLDKHGISNRNPRLITIDEFPESIRLTEKDILISRSGSLGLVSCVTDDIKDSVLSSHIFKVSLLTNKVLPKYLESYLRSVLGQFQFFQKNNGGVIPEINQAALKDISIVLPPLPKQKEIAEHINAIYSEAQQLQYEAKQILADAKTTIERMILGEADSLKTMQTVTILPKLDI